MPNCDACYGKKTNDCPDDCLTSHIRYEDAYWNAKDDFEHDIKELFGQFISPEEFEKKWRPRLKILKTERYPHNQKWYPHIDMNDCPKLSTCFTCSKRSCPVVDKAKIRYSKFKENEDI